jgi:chaperone modulatory protein CbpM
MSYALVHVRLAEAELDAAAFAQIAGMHPEMLAKLVALGLIEPHDDTSGRSWFAGADLARIARIQRLRAGLGLNYAAVGLVLDLLDRLSTSQTPVAGAATARRSGG